MKTPKELDRIVDLVLTYKPKPKSEGAKNREKKRRKIKRKKSRE